MDLALLAWNKLRNLHHFDPKNLKILEKNIVLFLSPFSKTAVEVPELDVVVVSLSTLFRSSFDSIEFAIYFAAN